MKKTICFLIILYLSGSFTLIKAQEVRVFVKDIKEERRLEEDQSFIELDVIIKGLKVNDSNQVKIHKITKAVDDLGNTLHQKESYFGDDYSGKNSITIKLEAPVRAASQINLIEGSLKRYSPSVKNGSKLILKNPLRFMNKNLIPKNASNVKLTMIDQNMLKELQEKDEIEYQKKLEKLKEQEVLGEGLAEIVDAFKDFFDGFSGFGSNEEKLHFYLEDEEEKIVDVFFFNEKGKKMNSGRSQYGSHKVTYGLDEKINEKWIIEILLETEDSMKFVDFKIADIILP